MEVVWHGEGERFSPSFRLEVEKWVSEASDVFDFRSKITITFADAAMKKELFGLEFPNQDYPGDDGFRALVSFKDFRKEVPRVRIFVFRDEAEHDDSTFWVLCHELAHVALRESNFLQQAVRILQYGWLKGKGLTPEEYFSNPSMLTDDNLHEEDPEESFCNLVASSYLGGRDYSRTWWRKRRKELKLEV